jgi:hypothetical protein
VPVHDRCRPRDSFADPQGVVVVGEFFERARKSSKASSSGKPES